jgi:hypothetical protein
MLRPLDDVFSACVHRIVTLNTVRDSSALLLIASFGYGPAHHLAGFLQLQRQREIAETVVLLDNRCSVVFRD